MIAIFTLSLIKIIWLFIDPFIQFEAIDRKIERVLDELIYSFIFAIFAIILIVWYTLF